MTNEKRHDPLGHPASGFLFTLAMLWLSAALAFAAAAKQKKQPDSGEAAQFKIRPADSGCPLPSPQIDRLAALPVPPYPPYNPVPMTADIGTTGLVSYYNTNGVALVNPRNHTISPIMLNEYDATIDPETNKPVGGPLGSEGGYRFDLAMTRDGRQALISNLGDYKIFFVDLSSGTPAVSGMVKIDFYPEDIAIDPTNEWALVSGVGFSTRIAVLHIPSRTWVPAGVDAVTGDPCSFNLIIDPGDVDDPDDDVTGTANGVAIAADGRTVVLSDFYGNSLHVCLFDPLTGGLAYRQSVKLWKYGTDETAAFPFPYYPINVAISPDGRTVLAANLFRSTYPGDPDPDAFFEGCNIPVFTIDQPGHIVRHPDVILPFRITLGQTIVFSPDGRRAYLESCYADDPPPGYDPNLFWLYQEVQALTVSGPGQVRHSGSVRTPTRRANNGFFGVDIMAITPDGNFLYVTNPATFEASPVIDVINLRTLTHAKSIGTPQAYDDPANPGHLIYPNGSVLPVGIAFPKALPNKPPVAVIDVDKPQLILDINDAATFDGSGSYDPERSPLTHAWSLVSAPAGAAATLTPSGQAAVLTPDPAVEGTYQVGLVVNDGVLDSAMATASVKAVFYPVYAPAGALLQRLENDFIFSREYVNRLAWTANPENLGAIAAIRVYRKPKGAGDDSYALQASLAAAATGYDDRGLAADQLFTYRIAAVSGRGKESDPVTVGN